MCVCVLCVCFVCVFSVCVCVCVCVFNRYFNHTNTISIFTPNSKKHASHKNLHPTQFPKSYSNTALFRPTNPRMKKVTFEFLLRLSVFYFLFSAIPTGFLTFCLPAVEATAKSVTKYSPTDSEKQTAVVCKDNGLFSLTKPLLCQKPSTLVKTPPVLVLFATLATVRV